MCSNELFTVMLDYCQFSDTCVGSKLTGLDIFAVGLSLSLSLFLHHPLQLMPDFARVRVIIILVCHYKSCIV